MKLTHFMIAEDDNFILHYDPSISGLSVLFRGYMDSFILRKKLSYLITALADHSANKLFTNMALLPLVSTADQTWIVNEWLPEALQAGCRAWAIVNSTYYFNRVALQTLLEAIARNENFSLQLFEDEKEARSWLQAIKLQ